MRDGETKRLDTQETVMGGMDRDRDRGSRGTVMDKVMDGIITVDNEMIDTISRIKAAMDMLKHLLNRPQVVHETSRQVLELL